MTLIAWFLWWRFSVTNDWDPSDWICQETHNKKKTFQAKSAGEYGANQEPSGVRVSILVEKKQRDYSYVVFWVELEAKCIPIGG